MTSLNDFRFPVRDADIFFNDDPTYTEEDKVADADFNQRAVEDYLSNTLPNVYIQQSELGSGVIDPAQLASGTPGAGKAPVGSPPAWTDIATQAELDIQSASLYGSVFTTGVLRGAVNVTDMNGTNTVFVAQFATAFASVPYVTATVECGARIGFFPTLISVNTTSFVGMIFTTNSTTATARVHYHAVKQ